MNEELQENTRETELELREERDNALVRLSEVRVCFVKCPKAGETYCPPEKTRRAKP